MARSCIRSIALVNPLGDHGISSYTWELANGLTANEVSVDVFGSGSVVVDLQPALHGFYPVLGSVLFRQRDVLRGKVQPSVAACPSPGSLASTPTTQTPPCPRSALLWRTRQRLLSLELALYLKSKGYDIIWTQWPDMEGYGPRFWRWCKVLGMKVVHTVHNVVPHEEAPGDRAICEKVYRWSDLLFVHSAYTQQELKNLFPEVAARIVVARLGAYTVYPRRPQARCRLRRELGIRNDQVALLFCGHIRPYKNLDPVMKALADERCSGTMLIVAGEESGYPESSPQDPLARSRALAAKAGILERTRFVPGALSNDELAELLEAGDVMMLPYLKSYGSGLLLLGMTFGRYIVATAAGGMDEYVRLYPRSTILQGNDTEHLIKGIIEAREYLRTNPQNFGEVPPEFQWPNIAREALDKMQETFCR